MKTIDSIPTGKLGRTSKLLTTGVKVGGNYLKYYGKKALNPGMRREELDQDNAEDIYNGLKQLKGSALKVAQMLSMEKNMLPKAYVEQFSLAQFSVPPLSAPLVRKTFKNYFGDYPEALFDTFATQAVHAASIGQVHLATKDGKKLAVKIQYPGVANSISSDLAMVKPVAKKMFNIKGKGSEQYFTEVEEKLLEETDYILEMKQSQFIAQSCGHIPGLHFPDYYPEYSSDRIITMDYMDGIHISEWATQNTDQEAANKLGQTLWDFFMYQMHVLRQVHADPHPGNFLVNKDQELIALDFGCVKQVPDDFYYPYFELANHELLRDRGRFMEKLYQLEILKNSDSKEEVTYFSSLFGEMLRLFSLPFNQTTFDFNDSVFWDQITDLSLKLSQDTQLRKMNGNRGSRHFLYVNRTFFGLYHLLHDLKATVHIVDFQKLKMS